VSGWQLSGDAPTAYTRFAVPFMSSWTDGLIQAARCRHGDRVLDVACGTGTVANRIREVSGAECRITGLDVNEGMLNVARRNEAIDWHLASAVDMPFPDGSFDVVLCQQGLQYFPDRSAAVGEMARVLAPGGRLALNVWGAIEHNAAQHAATEVVEIFFGADVAAPFRLAFTLNTREELRALASGASLTNIHVRLEHRTARYPDLAE
jgi:ubiquinone/menaquinone biosynthesis C-methylase UbiE